MNVEDFRLLFEYNSWANRRTLDSCAALSDEQLTRDLGSSYRSIRDTLVHIMLIEWLWHERWHGRSHSAYPPNSEFPDLAAIRRRWEEIDGNLRDYIASLTAEDLRRLIEYKTTAGVPQASPPWQMLQHVANHGTYHRGQIATLLRQSGAKAGSTDMIFFYRQCVAREPA